MSKHSYQCSLTSSQQWDHRLDGGNNGSQGSQCVKGMAANQSINRLGGRVKAMQWHNGENL